MRKFVAETKFLNERAINLTKTTMPIKDHGEIGFSGENGDMSFDDLIHPIEMELDIIGNFKFVYGTEEITEAKIQSALAQFMNAFNHLIQNMILGRAL